MPTFKEWQQQRNKKPPVRSIESNRAFFNSLRERRGPVGRQEPQEDPNKLRVVQPDQSQTVTVGELPPQPSVKVIDSPSQTKVLPPTRQPIEPRGPAKPMPVVGANGTYAPWPSQPKPSFLKQVDTFVTRDLPEGVTGTFRDWAMPIPRAVARTTLGIFGAGTPNYSSQGASRLERAVGPVLFGEGSKNETLSEQGKTILPRQLEKGPIPFLAGAALAVGEFSGLGGARKGVTKALTEAKEVSSVLKILKQANVADDIARDYAPIIAKTTKEADVEKLVSRIEDLQKTTKTGQALEPSRRTLTDQSQNLVSRGQQTLPTETAQQAKVLQLSQKPGKTTDYALDSTLPKIVTDDPSLATSARRVNEYISENRNALRAASGLEPGVVNPNNVTKFEQFKRAAGNLVTKTREFWEDSWIRGKELVKTADKQMGGISGSSADFYQQKILMPGRIQARIDEATKVFDNIDKEIIRVTKERKLPPTELYDDAQDYLIAKHAVERNASVGTPAASGITNSQAQEILKRVESSSNFADVERVANEYRKLDNQVLDILLDGGLIKPSTYKSLKEKYPNHVPLQRAFEEWEDFNKVLNPKGMSVPRNTIYSAKGSTRNIADVRENIFANLNSAIKQTERNRVNLSVLEFARKNKHLGLFEEVPYFGANKNDPKLLFMFENGVHRVLKINDPHVAVMLRGLGQQQIPQALEMVTKITRLYSALATRYNPEFLLSNKVRDLQELVVFMSSQKELGLKSSLKSLKSQGSDVAAVWDYFKGVDSEGAKLYRQLKLDGGTTGGMALSTKKQVEASLSSIFAKNRKLTKKMTSQLVDSIDKINTVFEDSTRLSVYREALRRGLPRDKAAALAKESTIDFNKMGTGGPLINSLYMFANASIQGSTKTLRSLKNPKVLGTLALVVGGGTWTINSWNDSVDPNWRDKVNKWDRSSNLAVAIPSEEGVRYITIPISWGLKPLKVMADSVYDMANDFANPVQAIQDTVASFVEAYNPLGGSDLLSAVTPSVLDAPVDIARNKAWHGGKVRPDSDPNAADVTKYFKSQQDTFIGRTTKRVADFAYDKFHVDVSPANMKYAYEQLVGGAGRATSRVINTLSSIGQGELPKASETPFLNRFYKSKSEDDLDSGVLPKASFYETNARVRKDQSVTSKKAKEAVDWMLSSDPKDQAKFEQLKSSGKIDKEFADAMYEEFNRRAKGLTDFEQSFSKSSLKARGEYIYKLLSEADPQGKAEIVQYLDEKGLLTKSLMDAIIEASNNK